MKTKIEINGYEITIEEKDGNISILAEKDGDVIDEISLKSEQEEEEEKEEKSEEDELEMDERDEDEDEEKDEESKNESLLNFESFLKRKSK